jgi:hypothetical protein
VSRTIGIITAVVGIVFLGIYYAVACDPVEILTFSVIIGAGAMIGGILGMGIFLVSIMKS